MASACRKSKILKTKEEFIDKSYNRLQILNKSIKNNTTDKLLGTDNFTIKE
jgi:hypothetical protein